jgi:general secretion pathway protein D
MAGPLYAQKTPVRSPAPSEPITLNFAGADIEAVARTLATLSGRIVVVDPRVKGTINLVTERPIPPAAAWNQFLALLRLQGYAMVESAGLYKILPEAEAKLQGGTVSSSGSASPANVAGNQLLVRLIKLNHETANNLVPVLRPLISPNNTINVNPGTNELVITDYADNLQRIERIVAALDVPNATDVDIVPLRHALATDLAPLVLRLIESGNSAPAAGQGQADTSYKTTVVAEPRSNALILRAANQARLAQVRALVAKLDQPSALGSNGPAGNIYVVHLKNADATKLAANLRAALTGDNRSSTTTTTTTNTTGNTATTGANTSSTASANTTGGQIQADTATNSLIITAPEPQYRQLRAVIDELDTRRPQVLVESLIVEVNADKAAEFGIQWQGALGNGRSNNVGLLGTNFSVGGANIIALATGAANGTSTPSTGLNLGLAHKTNGVYVLGFLARFLQSNGDGNILSTPSLLTLDNEEAKIVIGQNVPFVTGTYTSTSGGSSSVNPFQTVERKDVGLTLRVKPQISENGTVKLQIFQEVSSVQASSVNSATGLITNKRSIESNVLVEDGGIVVLGGLLQDEYAGNQEKVPGIANLPLVGNLFKSEARSRKKTNLMVFLRPVVVRDAEAADALTQGRYDLMRGTQQASQPEANPMLSSIDQAPVLPAAATDAQRARTPAR